MREIRLKSPAKLNLHLEVLRKRSDGYHEIKTLFERIDLCDVITIAGRKSGIAVRCDDKSIPRDGRNLAYKAARIFRENYGIKDGVSIRIEKRIPVAAGMGGGSSNAAAVLMGLAKFYGKKTTRDELLGLARKIGADVAFFIYEKSFAMGRRRGDEISPLRKKGVYWHVILNPGVKVETRKVYGELDRRGLPRIYGNSRKNRLFECAVRICPEINKAADILKSAGARDVYMTGSGPTLFTIHRCRKEALELMGRLTPGISGNGYKAFVAKTL